MWLPPLCTCPKGILDRLGAFDGALHCLSGDRVQEPPVDRQSKFVVGGLCVFLEPGLFEQDHDADVEHGAAHDGEIHDRRDDGLVGVSGCGDGDFAASPPGLLQVERPARPLVDPIHALLLGEPGAQAPVPQHLFDVVRVRDPRDVRTRYHIELPVAP